MIHIPTLKQLKYLCAVANHKHFGRAANACFVSQSTLSAGIQELEEILGVRLLERDKKHVKLTAIGEEITERAEHILTATEDLVAIANQAQKPFSTDMRLGVIPTIAPFLLPKILKHIRRKYPNFKLFIREELSAHLVRELSSGELDLLLLALPYPAENVVTEHLFFDDFFLAYEKSHPIGKRKKVTTADLPGKELLLLEDGHCLRDHAMEACKLSTKDLHVPFQATSLNTIIQMVANGIGITILPKMAVDAKILQGTDVQTRPFDEDKVWRSIGLMWRKNSAREEEYKLFAQLVRDALG